MRYTLVDRASSLIRQMDLEELAFVIRQATSQIEWLYVCGVVRAACSTQLGKADDPVTPPSPGAAVEVVTKQLSDQEQAMALLNALEREYLKYNQPIEAIKAFRNRVNCGLRVAKQVIDRARGL